MLRVFISYRREDTAGWSGRLYDRLATRFGKDRVFRDVTGIKPGEDFTVAIRRKIEKCHVLIALIGRSWLSDRLHEPTDHLRQEIASALPRGADVRVVPVLVDGAQMPAESDLPEDIRELARRQAFRVRDEQFDRDVEDLLGRLVEQATPSPEPEREVAREQPPIHYARTVDGFDIAYYTVGEGEPLLFFPSPPLCHLEIAWENPGLRELLSRLARNHMVVRWDPRGTGLSQRIGESLPVENMLEIFGQDITAISEKLGFDRFALLGEKLSGAVGMHYAASHPERVSSLILESTSPRLGDLLKHKRLVAAEAVRKTNWDVYVEIMASTIVGGVVSGLVRRLAGSPAEADDRQIAHWIRESISPETWAEVMEFGQTLDLSDLLPKIQAPTLILHRKGLEAPSVADARGMASRIPDARLVLLDGTSMLPWLEDLDNLVESVSRHLSR